MLFDSPPEPPAPAPNSNIIPTATAAVSPASAQRRRDNNSTSFPQHHALQPALELASDRGLSDVTLSGTFVSPDPIIAVLPVAAAARSHLSSSSSGPAVIGTVWTAESGGWVRVRHAITGEVQQQRRIAGMEPTCMAHCAVSRTVWVGTSDGPLIVFDVDSVNKVAECMLHEAGVTCVLVPGSASRSAGGSNVIDVHNTTNSSSSMIAHHQRNSNVNSAAAASQRRVSNNSTLWSAGSDGRIAVWDTTSCSVVRCFLACHGAVNCLASLGALGVAANGNDGTICVWPLEKPSSSDMKEVPTAMVSTAISAQQHGHDASNVSQSQQQQQHQQQPAAILSLCTVSETLLWSGSEDGSIRVWQYTHNALRPVSTTAISSPLRTLHGGAAVHCITKEPAGSRVWTASLDGKLALWDSVRIALLSQMPVSFPPRGNHFVFSVAPVAVASAQRLWACSTDGTVRSWLSLCDPDYSLGGGGGGALNVSASGAQQQQGFASPSFLCEVDELHERAHMHSDWARGVMLLLQDFSAVWCDLHQGLRERANIFADESEQELSLLRGQNADLRAALDSETRAGQRLSEKLADAAANGAEKTSELQRMLDEERSFSARLKAQLSEYKMAASETDLAIVDLRDALSRAREQVQVLTARNEGLDSDARRWGSKARDLEQALREEAERGASGMSAIRAELERTVNALAVSEAANDRSLALVAAAEMDQNEAELRLAELRREHGAVQQRMRDAERSHIVASEKVEAIVVELRQRVAVHQAETVELRGRVQGLELDLEREHAAQRALRQHTDDEIRQMQGRNSSLRDELTATEARAQQLQQRALDAEDALRAERERNRCEAAAAQQATETALARLRQEKAHLQHELDAQLRAAEELRAELDAQAGSNDRERERNRELRGQTEELQARLVDAQRAAASNERRAAAALAELDTCRASVDRHSADLRDALQARDALQEKHGALARRQQEESAALREAREDSARLQGEARRMREQLHDSAQQLRDAEVAFGDRLARERAAEAELAARLEAAESGLKAAKSTVRDLQEALSAEQHARAEAEARMRVLRDEMAADHESTHGAVAALKAQILAEREAAGRTRAQLEAATADASTANRELAAVRERYSSAEREVLLEQHTAQSARERLHNVELALEQARAEQRGMSDAALKENAALKRQIAALEAERDSAAQVMEQQHAEITKLRAADNSAGDVMRRMREIRSASPGAAIPIPRSYIPSSPPTFLPQQQQQQQQSAAARMQPFHHQRERSRTPDNNNNNGALTATTTRLLYGGGGRMSPLRGTNYGSQPSSAGLTTPMWSPPPRM